MNKQTKLPSSTQPTKRIPSRLPPGTIAYTPIVREGKLIEFIVGVIGRDGLARRVDEWELHWWELARRYIDGKRGEPEPARMAHFEIGYHHRLKKRADPLESDPIKVYQQTKAYLAEQRRKSGEPEIEFPMSAAIEQVFGRMVNQYRARQRDRRILAEFGGGRPIREPGEEG